jgi:hypothetical protein
MSSVLGTVPGWRGRNSWSKSNVTETTPFTDEKITTNENGETHGNEEIRAAPGLTGRCPAMTEHGSAKNTMT